MTKQITGVLIDPENGIAEVRTLEESLDSFYSALHCTCIDIVNRTIGIGANRKQYVIICDDEGLLKDGNFTSAIDRDHHPMLVGSLFVCKDGQDHSLASLTDEEVDHVMSYTREVCCLVDGDLKFWSLIYAMDYD